MSSTSSIVEPLSLRQSFTDALIACADERDDFVLLEADATGATFTGQFTQRFPERHVACGIAEQNMIGMAAGLATTGVTPVATTMAVFVSLRALEQFRTSVCYGNRNVKLVVSHLGIDIGEDGPTAAAIEDLGVLGAIPNLTVLSPTDDVEMHAMVRWMLEHEGPVYLRTGRSPVPRLLPDDYRFVPGHWPTVRPGSDVTLVGIGITVSLCVQAAELLEREGISAEVIAASCFKPTDEQGFAARAAKTRGVVTLEDHNRRGGLGSRVSEILSWHAPMPVESIGLDDQFAESGATDALFRKYGLTPENVVARARRVLERNATAP